MGDSPDTNPSLPPPFCDAFLGLQLAAVIRGSPQPGCGENHTCLTPALRGSTHDSRVYRATLAQNASCPHIPNPYYIRLIKLINVNNYCWLTQQAALGS